MQRLLPVTLFTLAYMAVATASAVASGNMEFISYIVVVVVLGITAILVHRRVHFHPLTFWLLSLWGLLHMIGGLVHLPTTWMFEPPNNVVYSWWIVPHTIKVDNLIHAYGFGLTTWVCWQALKAGTNLQKMSIGLLILCALASTGLGSINEIIEFIVTILVPSTNVGGYENTLWDLIWNVAGCTVASVLIWTFERRSSSSRIA